MSDYVSAYESLKLFPGKKFKHHKKPPPYWTVNPKTGVPSDNGRACDVCAMRIKGSEFHCKEENIDVHEVCSRLEETIRVGDDVFNLEEGKAESKCIWCRQMEPKESGSSIEGFRYESRCGDYTFHVFCLMDMHRSAIEKDFRPRPNQVSKVRRTSQFGKVVEKFLTAALRILFGDPTVFISSVLLHLLA